MSAPAGICRHVMSWQNRNGLPAPATPEFGLNTITLGSITFILCHENISSGSMTFGLMTFGLTMFGSMMFGSRACGADAISVAPAMTCQWSPPLLVLHQRHACQSRQSSFRTSKV
jgi:hypothetical protein